MSTLDHEEAAKNDIAARPQVTGNAEKMQALRAGSEQGKPAMPAPAEQNLDPETLEKAAGRVITKGVGELKTVLGGSVVKDTDFDALLSESLTGLFSAARVMTGKPWLKFAIAGGALAFSFVPAAVRYAAAKREKEEKEPKK